MEISLVNRKSSVLSASSLMCFQKRALTINPAIGCAHQCAYCYVRGYLAYPGDGRVDVYANLVEKIGRELPRKRKKPEVVFFSTACDAFQPVPQVLKTSYDIMRILLDNGIAISFLTKGSIPANFLELFKSFPELVCAKIGLITTDREIQRIFEPHAATPSQRLANIRKLSKCGVRVELRMDPIIPGVTDTRKCLQEYFHAIKGLGAQAIFLNYLLLRNQIKKNLQKAVSSTAIYEKIVGQYKKGGKVSLKAANSKAFALSKDYRTQKYAMIAKLAGVYNIKAHVCGCKNPDIAGNMVCV